MAFDPVFGASHLQAEIQKNEAKGNVIRGITKYLTSNFDKPTVDRMMETLTPQARALIVDPPLASAWVKFQPMMELVKGLGLGPLKGDLPKLREVSAKIARDDLSTVYKVLLKMLSGPSFMINRIGTVHDMYARGMVMRGEVIEPGQAVVKVTSGALPYYYCTWAVCGWIEAALDIYRAQKIVIKHSECRHKGGEQCLWNATWE